jgi:hypothetical protein
MKNPCSSTLTSHSGGSDCEMLWSPESEDDQGISNVIGCRRTNPLAAK